MKKEKVISIIGNGEKPNESLKEIILNSEVIIAADGGANICAELDIKPHYIVGDFDSISAKNMQKFSNSKIIQIEEQQTSDLEKAFNFAVTLSPDLIRIFSVFGKRSDHSFYNLYMFWKWNKKYNIEFYDNFGYWKCYRPGQYNFSGEIGENISFFSQEKITNFESFGFKYSVKFGDYENGLFSLSNTFQKKTAKIKFTSGRLLVYRTIQYL